MIIAPSILTADFTALDKELKKIESADFAHIDIMDGHFVPNISFGPNITKQINQISTLKLDVHLMVTDPVFWIDQFSFDKVEYITIHIESNDYRKAIENIKKNNKKVGISIKPNTPVEKIISMLNEIDLVLVMTVEPGFGGQSFMEPMMDKVKQLVNLRRELGLDFIIEVDGGVNDKTIEICRQSGVDMAVAGSYVFNHKDPKKAIEGLK
jgi:ribulose-phosphate 3-epimerase